MANPDLMKHKNIIDVVKYRPLWLSISAILYGRHHSSIFNTL